MSTNKNADEWLESYQIPFGYDPKGEGQKESLAKSLQSTNGAAYRSATAAEALASGGVQAQVEAALAKVPAATAAPTAAQVAAEVLENTRFEWQNQENVPADQRGTDSVRQNLQATNGQVYRNASTLEQILDRLVAIEAKLTK